MIAASSRRQTMNRAAKLACVLRSISLACFVLLSIGAAAWAQERDESRSVSLSSEDRSWLASHQPIRLGLYKGGWAPFDLMDRTGRHQGISADYLALVTQRLGIMVEPIVYPDWHSVLDAAKRHEIDLMVSVAQTAERE